MVMPSSQDQVNKKDQEKYPPPPNLGMYSFLRGSVCVEDVIEERCWRLLIYIRVCNE